MDNIPNPNWPRWIFASLAEYFYENRQSMDFFIEGQNRPTTVSDFGELRLSGPYLNQVNPGNWVIDVIVTTLIQIVQTDDLYKLDNIIGIFLAAYKTNIDVLKLGTGEDDDQTQLGCLRLVSTTGEKIRVDKFGQIQAANRIAQATIEARYRLTLG